MNFDGEEMTGGKKTKEKRRKRRGRKDIKKNEGRSRGGGEAKKKTHGKEKKNIIQVGLGGEERTELYETRE